MVSLIKSIVSAVSAIVVFLTNIFSIPQVISDLPTVPQDFKPIIRFAVASDIHLKPTGSCDDYEVERNRLVDMIKTSYSIAESDKSGYTALDGIIIAGDFTDDGDYETMVEYKEICEKNMKSGTKLMTVLGNHDVKTYSIGTQFVFKKVFGEGDNFHYVINGFHFIGISPSISDRTFLNREAWLEKQLKIAAEDSPNMPIFVTQHTNIKDTIFGSEIWGNHDDTFLLAQYPQVINFSGHSHYPINDPRSFWQGSFTAVGTGTLSYFCSDIDGDRVTPDNCDNAAQMWIVEADANGSVRLRGYDLISHSFIGKTYFIENPSDKTTFAYNTTNMEAKSHSPVFADNAVVTVKCNDDKTVDVSFPKATVANDEIVFYYRISVTDSNSNEVQSVNKLDEYQTIPEPDSYNVKIKNLEPGKYTVTVVAVNPYKKTSSPISKSFELK